MMLNTSFVTLLLMISYSILTVMHAADITDPCTSNLDYTANMCTDDSIIEDNVDGSRLVDSVLLRIEKHQNNCICHVTLQKTITNYTIYMSKNEGLSDSAPEEQNCGLAVDVNYVDTSNTSRSLQSIDCAIGTSLRSIDLGGNELILTSRIISGDFTRGYCMQISRDQAIYKCNMNDQVGKAGSDEEWVLISNTQRHSSINECKQYCIKTDFCVAVHYEDANSHCFVYNRTTEIITKPSAIYSQKHCVDTQKLKIKCDLPESTTQTDQVTTTEDTFTTKTETVTTTISDSRMTNSNTHSTITEEKKITKDKNSDMYVYIGAGAGGLLMILLIVCIIVCIRKRVNQTPLKQSKNDSTKQFSNENRDSNYDYGGLKDNILYVSSEPNEVLEDGNYNTVDLEQTRKVDQDNTFDGNYSTVDGTCNIIGSDSSLSKSKPVIKPKPKTSFKSGSVDETTHLSTMDNGNNEYAVVDKGRHSDAVKHINPVLGNDTEYAVVNKVRK